MTRSTVEVQSDENVKLKKRMRRHVWNETISLTVGRCRGEKASTYSTDGVSVKSVLFGLRMVYERTISYGEVQVRDCN